MDDTNSEKKQYDLDRQALFEKYPPESWVTLKVGEGRLLIDSSVLINVVEKLIRSIAENKTKASEMESEIQQSQDLAKQLIRKTHEQQLQSRGQSIRVAGTPTQQKQQNTPTGVENDENREKIEAVKMANMEKNVAKKTAEKINWLDEKLSKLVLSLTKDTKSQIAAFKFKMSEMWSHMTDHEDYVVKNIDNLMDASDRCQNDLERLGRSIEGAEAQAAEEAANFMQKIEEIKAEQQQIEKIVEVEEQRVKEVANITHTTNQVKHQQKELWTFAHSEIAEVRQFTSSKSANLYRDLNNKADSEEVRTKFDRLDNMVNILRKDLISVLAHVPRVEKTQTHKIHQIDKQIGKMEEGFHEIKEVLSERKLVGVCRGIKNMMQDPPSWFMDQRHFADPIPERMITIADESTKLEDAIVSEGPIDSLLKRPVKTTLAVDTSVGTPKAVGMESSRSTWSEFDMLEKSSFNRHTAYMKPQSVRAQAKTTSLVPKPPTAPKSKTLGNFKMEMSSTMTTELVDFMPVANISHILTAPRKRIKH